MGHPVEHVRIARSNDDLQAVGGGGTRHGEPIIGVGQIHRIGLQQPADIVGGPAQAQLVANDAEQEIGAGGGQARRHDQIKLAVRNLKGSRAGGAISDNVHCSRHRACHQPRVPRRRPGNDCVTAHAQRRTGIVDIKDS